MSLSGVMNFALSLRVPVARSLFTVGDEMVQPVCWTSVPSNIQASIMNRSKDCNIREKLFDQCIKCLW